MIRAADFQRRLRPLLPEADGWATRGKLTYRSPAEWVATGVFAESSGYLRDHLYIWVACVPLFVPLEHLALDHSWRVSNGSTPIAFDDEPALSETLARAVRDVPSVDQALNRIASSEAEASAYALLLLGDQATTAKRLSTPYFPNDDRQFVVEARDRRAAVATALERGGFDDAVQLLRG